MEVVKRAADGLVGEWGGEYIWQRENFGLEIVEDDGRPSHAGPCVIVLLTCLGS